MTQKIQKEARMNKLEKDFKHRGIRAIRFFKKRIAVAVSLSLKVFQRSFLLFATFDTMLWERCLFSTKP